MIDDLRVELELMESVYEAARDVRDQWRIRGDHKVERKLEDVLTLAVNDLEDWRDRQ